MRCGSQEPRSGPNSVAAKNIEHSAVWCDSGTVTNEAYILRENTGTSGIVESARAAVAVLADHDIPHLIVGGLAVQEHGYPRVTIDVDIVVPDVLEAVEFLTASVTGPFYRDPQIDNRVEDREMNGVMIDLVAGWKGVGKSGCNIPLSSGKSPAKNCTRSLLKHERHCSITAVHRAQRCGFRAGAVPKTSCPATGVLISR